MVATSGGVLVMQGAVLDKGEIAFRLAADDNTILDADKTRALSGARCGTRVNGRGQLDVS